MNDDLTILRRRAPAFRMADVAGFVASALVAMAGLASTSAVNAETFQDYSASVGGLRVGEQSGGFGASSEKAVPVSEFIGGTDWAASASASDVAGGTVSSYAMIASPASADPSFVKTLTASSVLSYAFILEGPATTTRIPILLTGAGGISANLDYGNASAILQFGSAADGINAIYSIDSVSLNMTPEDTSHSFAVKDIFYITPGSQLSIGLAAYANVSYPGVANGKVAVSSAYVDPTFTILGNFGSDYHFVGLPQSAIGASPVPEPATWFLMGAGFGVFGLRLRRRHSDAKLAGSALTP